MPEEEKGKAEARESKPTTSPSPLIFISHDTRDAELAEAFSKLLRSVSAGVLKTFRSSDKRGTEGIEFGDEWYKRLMSKIDTASDVVCLLTERSVERPWILYEAGVAKGKLKGPVLGIALGIPLGSVRTGPFYQFQNCDDSEDALTKLVEQLVRRVPSLEPDEDVVRSQVQAFKQKADEVLAALAQPDDEEEEAPSDGAAAKLFEETKIMLRDLPSRIEDQIGESVGVAKRRRKRRFHPMMMEEMMHFGEPGSEPLGLLLFASVVQDEAPWLAEIAREAFRAITSGERRPAERIRRMLQFLPEMVMRGPIGETLMMGSSKEGHMIVMEGSRILDHIMARCMEMGLDSSE